MQHIVTKFCIVCFRPKKFIRISRDDYFNSEDHHISTTPARAEKACAYDLDDTDIAWLEVFNGERAQVINNKVDYIIAIDRLSLFKIKYLVVDIKE